MTVIYKNLNQTSFKSSSTLSDIGVIYQSINNILKTRPRENILDPEFGCDLEAINFNLLTSIEIEKAYYIITSAIEKYEPRVILTESTRIVPYPDKKMLEIQLVFRIKGLGGKQFGFKATVAG